uniref:Si:dkey-16l2.20 n=1 Tax=Acanthochromis polyacanthus TaxID=80966 RepID=A0A3Q1FH18_9TELE
MIPLNTVPGTGDAENNDTCDEGVISAAPFCTDKHHRKLAICSIICGVSCIGVKALIYSVKAEMSEDLEAAQNLSQRAKKFSIISIVIWVLIVASFPLLMGLISYLLTLLD